MNTAEVTSAFSLAWQKAYSDQTCCAGCVGVPRHAENPVGYAHKSIPCFKNPRDLSKTQQIFGKTQGFFNSSVLCLLHKSVHEYPVNINLKQVSIPGKLRRSLDGRISRPLPGCCHPPMPQRKKDRIRTRRIWFHLGNDALACWKVESDVSMFL